MNKWLKYVKRLRKKEQIRLLETVGSIMNGQIKTLDIKKLCGYLNLYRVRVGRYRIVFEVQGEQNAIIKIDNKDDHTYDL